MPPPYLVAALVLVAFHSGRAGSPGRRPPTDTWGVGSSAVPAPAGGAGVRAWLAAGLAFGACGALLWGTPALLAAAAGPLLLVGARAGAWTWDALEAPTRWRVTVLLAGLGGALPAVLGALDLVLRAHTP
jgi:hypothetical protein